MHKTMSLENRCQCAMEGYLLVDLFRLVADSKASQMNLPKGALWLAPQTGENLQLVALSTIVLACSKEPAGNPFFAGCCRMTELNVEQWFGRLRVQATNAQLNSRSYWKAAAREMLRSKKKHDSCKEPPNMIDMEPLSDGQFFQCSVKAWKSALQLVSACSGFTLESLDHMYRQWSESGKFDLSWEDLLPEDDMVWGDKEDDAEADDAAGHPCQGLLDEVQNECQMDTELPNQDVEGVEEYQFELRNVPDADLLLDMTRSEPESPLKPYGKADPCDMIIDSQPMNLHDALLALPDCSEGPQMWDRLWRLCMYMRHWGGGCDRLWVKNPRSAHKASSKLNWFQFCVCNEWGWMGWGDDVVKTKFGSIGAVKCSGFLERST